MGSEMCIRDSTFVVFGNESFSGVLPCMDVYIVEEAAQAFEVETITPMALLKSGGHVFLVGDFAQLPPTADSYYVQCSQIGVSLMERLTYRRGFLCVKLKCQHRMMPNICWFASERFYFGDLISSESAQNQTAVLGFPWNSRYPGIAFVVSHGKEEAAGTSMINKNEARHAVQLVEMFLRKNVGLSVAVVCFYQSQVAHAVSYTHLTLPTKRIV